MNLTCPVCADPVMVSTGRNRASLDNIRNHMQRKHGMTADETNALLEARGIRRPSPVIDDEMLAQWGDMVSRGVIE